MGYYSMGKLPAGDVAQLAGDLLRVAQSPGFGDQQTGLWSYVSASVIPAHNVILGYIVSELNVSPGCVEHCLSKSKKPRKPHGKKAGCVKREKVRFRTVGSLL